MRRSDLLSRVLIFFHEVELELDLPNLQCKQFLSLFSGLVINEESVEEFMGTSFSSLIDLYYPPSPVSCGMYIQLYFSFSAQRPVFDFTL
jgi:hypothetical protein